MARLSKRKHREPVRTIDDRDEVDSPNVKTDENFFGEEPEADAVTPTAGKNKGPRYVFGAARLSAQTPLAPDEEPDEERGPIHYAKAAPDAYSAAPVEFWTKGREAEGDADKRLDAIKKVPLDDYFNALALETGQSLYRNTRVVGEGFSAVDHDTAEPVPFEAVFDLNEDASGGSSDTRTGFSIRGFEPHPEMQGARDREMYEDRRSLHNLDLEKRSRGSLRAAARHDPDEFRKALPADIFDRLLVADGDDVPKGLPIRHPYAAPSWPSPEWPDWFFDQRQDVDLDDLPESVPVVASGGGRLDIASGFSIPLVIPAKDRDPNAPPSKYQFTAPPRLKQTSSPGLAIGHVEVEAASTITSVNLHGVRVGLLRRDRPEPEPAVQIISGVFKDGSEWQVEYDPRTKEPLRSRSGKGRSLSRAATLAWSIERIEDRLARTPDCRSSLLEPTDRQAAGSYWPDWPPSPASVVAATKLLASACASAEAWSCRFNYAADLPIAA